MNQQTRYTLSRAQKLIRQGRTNEARRLLQTLSHPIATRWLTQLDARQQKTRPRRRIWLTIAVVCLALVVAGGGAMLFSVSQTGQEPVVLPTRVVMEPLASLTPLPTRTAIDTPTPTRTATVTPSASATITNTPRSSATPLPSLTASPSPSATPTTTATRPPARGTATTAATSAFQVIDITPLPTVPPGNEEHAQHAFRLVFGMRQIRDLTVDTERVHLGFVLDMSSTQSARNDVNQSLIRVVCNLRREGFTTQSYEFTGYRVQDTFQGKSYQSVATVLLLPETIASLDCRNQQAINLQGIAYIFIVNL